MGMFEVCLQEIDPLVALKPGVRTFVSLHPFSVRPNSGYIFPASVPSYQAMLIRVAVLGF